MGYRRLPLSQSKWRDVTYYPSTSEASISSVVMSVRRPQGIEATSGASRKWRGKEERGRSERKKCKDRERLVKMRAVKHMWKVAKEKLKRRKEIR